MRIEIKAIRWLTVTLLSLPGLALWAGGGGNILGTIKDPSGSPIANAKVTATETATGLKQTLTTDGRGFYSFASLPVGHYDVQVEASGFKPYRRTNVVIDVNGDCGATAQPSLFRSRRVAAHVDTPWVISYERDIPIGLCEGITQPLSVVWPKLRHYI